MLTHRPGDIGRLMAGAPFRRSRRNGARSAGRPPAQRAHVNRPTSGARMDRRAGSAAAADEGTVKVMQDDRVRALEDQRERLRAKIEALERERLCQTPSAGGRKQRVRGAKKWDAEESSP